jgi:isopenicillin-N N-acyltransferase like protein
VGRTPTPEQIESPSPPPQAGPYDVVNRQRLLPPNRCGEQRRDASLPPDCSRSREADAIPSPQRVGLSLLIPPVALPIARLRGGPYAQGLQHGRQLRDRIARNLAVYFERFAREGGLGRAEVLRRARRYASALGSDAYEQGVRGIARGGGFELLEIVALNVRYELLYHQLGAKALGTPLAGGCSAVAVRPEAATNGHLLVAQNWDWIPDAQGALIRTEEPDGSRTLGFTEAGIFGSKIGLSSRGLGLAINGLLSTDDDWERLGRPFHVRCHDILRAADLEAAVEVARAGARACSANFLLAALPDRVVDVETAPTASRCLVPTRPWLVHTNHFLEPRALGVTEPPMDDWHSCERYDRLRQLLAKRERVGPADLRRCLADHAGYPSGVCTHPDQVEPEAERVMTVTSIVMDLHARTLEASDGPPCSSPYRRLRLADARGVGGQRSAVGVGAGHKGAAVGAGACHPLTDP